MSLTQATPYVIPCDISDLLLIDGIKIFPDERGSFSSPYRKEDYSHPILQRFNLAQVNISKNHQGAIRGIHAEPWNKLIFILQGEVQSVIVELRKNHRNFRDHRTFVLGPTRALYVPKGCGNSFQALSDNETIVMYMTDRPWVAGVTYPAVSLLDKSLNIRWTIPEERWIISQKDREAKTVEEVYGA